MSYLSDAMGNDTIVTKEHLDAASKAEIKNSREAQKNAAAEGQTNIARAYGEVIDSALDDINRRK